MCLDIALTTPENGLVTDKSSQLFKWPSHIMLVLWLAPLPPISMLLSFMCGMPVGRFQDKSSQPAKQVVSSNFEIRGAGPVSLLCNGVVLLVFVSVVVVRVRLRTFVRHLSGSGNCLEMRVTSCAKMCVLDGLLK